MAEYFPLLERAVAGLKTSTPDARRALYERARAALLGQLRLSDPPVPESDIERESVALDEAIARVEANASASDVNVATEESDPSPAFPIASPASPLPVAPGPPAGLAPGLRPAAPRSARPAVERGMPAPPSSAIPTPGRERPAYPFRNLDPGPAANRPAPPVRPAIPIGADAKGETGAPRLGSALGSVDLDASSTIGDEAVLNRPAVTNDRKVAPLDPITDASGDDVEAERDVAAEAKPLRDKPRKRGGPDTSVVRPAAPVRSDREPRRTGLYVTLVVLLLLAGGVAVAAYLLRDRPEQLVAARPDVTVGDDSPNKVANRAEPPSTSTPLDQPAPIATGSAESAAPPSDVATLPAPIAQGSERASRGPQSNGTADASMTPDAAAPSASNAPTPDIGVSQRAGMLVDAPDDPQKVKTYAGAVVWRMDSISAGQGQPLSNAVRADVDIPDAKLTMSMVLKRNVEPQFPASHTIEFHFTEQPGNTLGPVKQINVPELRRDDTAPAGDALAGVPVSITDDYFLVGLSRGAAEQSNLQLLTQRNWIDVSIMLASGKIAKVAFEKGVPGQKILEDALASWR